MAMQDKECRSDEICVMNNKIRKRWQKEWYGTDQERMSLPKGDIWIGSWKSSGLWILKNSYPDRKNSISRGRKVGLQHVYLDYLRTKLTLQEGFLRVATVGTFGQIRWGPVYKGSRMSSGDVRICEIELYDKRNKKLKTILGRLRGYVCSTDISLPAISLFYSPLMKDSLIHRISSKSLRTFRNVLETFRNRALKLVR